MVRFVNNEFKVLVCTTIIETGIDIPNANTIIIENADTFGLSQLYQIKGRVGRSDRLAYAYLFYKPNKQLSEVAQKRLKAIKEFATLGSGYKIAMRQEARSNKDYAQADALRNKLSEIGIVLEDTPQGVRWKKQ